MVWHRIVTRPSAVIKRIRLWVYCFIKQHTQRNSFVKHVNTLGPGQNLRHFADIFKCIFLDEMHEFRLKIPLKFVPKARINNIQALVQIMAWCRPGDKPLYEPMMFSLLTHIICASLRLKELTRCSKKSRECDNPVFLCHLRLRLLTTICCSTIYPK